jgi:hypothetical protein
MALLFGLSLSNHWPLMLLVAPAFAVLLWPRRLEILQRLPLLAALLALGLLPYAWMVWLSWTGRAISFDGPLQSIGEVWHFVSRDGYAEVDDSPSAGWADRLRYFGFFGGELLRQFAVAGALVAAVGAVVQWRELGGRTAGFLSAAFLMPSVVLLLLLNFDYDALHKHVFHVYPLPAYGVAALWMGIGAAWLARHWSLGAAQARLGAFALLAAIAAVGCRGNLMWSYDWPARYAHAVLRSLPQGAAVFASGEPDLAPIAYFHMVEGMRPDITLYQPQGLILGNRLFHPLRTDASTAKAIVRAFIEQDPRPVAFTLGVPPGYAQRDRWLHVELDRTASDAATVTPELSEDAMRFAEDALLELRERNAYAAYVQGQLRRHYGRVLGRTLPVGGETEVRRRRHLDLLGRDFFGSLGVVEGILAQGPGAPLDQAVRYLQRARDLMPGDVGKSYQARYLELRAYVRLEAGDRAAALRDLRAALAVWPVSENTAIPPLEDLYRQAGDEQAVTAVRAGLRD